MEHGASLQDLMNRMAGRLDDILPDDLQDMPVDRDWPFIHLYLGSDPVLAQLYKQYCDARDRLSCLRKEFGRDDAMADIAADMKDSAHSAVETRLLELKDGREAQGQVTPHVPIFKQKAKADPAQEAFDKMIALMIWAKLTLKSGKPPQNVKRQFALAA